MNYIVAIALGAALFILGFILGFIASHNMDS